jgi:hypothetical protein
LSSVIDPIIKVDGNRKITKVTITVAAGAQYGTGTAAGLIAVEQALAWSPYGAGATAVGAGDLSVPPYVNGAATGQPLNGVGISQVAASGAAVTNWVIEVQGY